MAEKLFYSMGEVAEMFDVNLSLIRYWESKFDVLKPKKNKKGNRMFRPEDIENFKLIYHLVKECGMTLEGAQRAMRNRGKSDVSRSAELMERLQSVKSMLLEMREMLGKEEDDEVVIDDEPVQTAAPALAPEPEPELMPEPQPVAQTAVRVIEPGRSQRLEEKKKAEEQKKAEERNVRKPELPFYEQTLF